jgi:hypothetical protein
MLSNEDHTANALLHPNLPDVCPKSAGRRRGCPPHHGLDWKRLLDLCDILCNKTLGVWIKSLRKEKKDLFL